MLVKQRVNKWHWQLRVDRQFVAGLLVLLLLRVERESLGRRSWGNWAPSGSGNIPDFMYCTNYKTNYLLQCIVLKTFTLLKPSIHIKINFKITPTCFGPTGPSSGSTSFLSQSYRWSLISTLHCGSAGSMLVWGVRLCPCSAVDVYPALLGLALECFQV